MARLGSLTPHKSCLATMERSGCGREPQNRVNGNSRRREQDGAKSYTVGDEGAADNISGRMKSNKKTISGSASGSASGPGCELNDLT